MKKVLLILAVLLGFTVAASAQSRVIGLRGGFLDGGLAQLRYEYTMGADNFIEGNLGGYISKGSTCFDLTGLYNFMLAHPDWTSSGEWGVYVGPGASLGTYMDDDKSALRLGVCAQVGLEYTFDFPLHLSVDIRPVFDFVGIGFNPSLTFGIGYRF